MKNSSQAKKRVDWVDYAKGIGIFLVVLGHVLRGLSDSVGLAYLSQLQAIDTWIYAFHMPFFFFLSGLFMTTTEKKNFQNFWLDKLRTILYPYLIWSGLIGLLRIFSGQSKENLLSFIANFWRIIYQPIDTFWFLYVFFLISTLYFLLRKQRVAPAHILFGTIFLYSISQLFPHTSFWSPLEKIGLYSVYFAIGAVLSSWLLNCTHISNTFLLTGMVVGFAVFSFAIHFDFLVSKNPNLALSLLGITSCLLLSKLLDQCNWLGFLKDWGSLSLQIYVAHTAASAAIRIVLQKIFNIDELLIHIVLGTVSGIYLPILLNWLVTKIKFPYLFTIPRSSKAA